MPVQNVSMLCQSYMINSVKILIPTSTSNKRIETSVNHHTPSVVEGSDDRIQLRIFIWNVVKRIEQ